jgi:hypothetical protein
MTLSKIKKVGVLSPNTADSSEIVARAKHVNPIIDVVNALTDGTSTAFSVSTGTVTTLTSTTANIETVAATTAITGTFSSSVATATLINPVAVGLTTTGASAVNMVEVARYTLTSAVKMGNWANALCAKIDLTTTGYVTGLAGAICAELDLPTTNPSGGAGTYTCFEGELVFPASGYTSTVPVSFFNLNASGTTRTVFDTNGYLMDISGLSVASGKIFQVNTATAATHALRIRIGGTPYYMMLTSVGA